VLVPPSSKLTFKEDVVNLNAGTASINTTSGMSAQAESYKITPANSGAAKFDVNRSDSLIQVHATKGALTVRSSSGVLSVPEGQTAILNVQNGSSAQSDNANTSKSKAVAPVFNLQQALTDDPSTLGYCSHVICSTGNHVSGIHPCKCVRL